MIIVLLFKVLISIILHEFARYIMFRHYGYIPSFYFNYPLVGRDIYRKIPIHRLLFISLNSFIIGLIFVITDPILTLIYIIMYFPIINILIRIIRLIFKGKDIKIYTLNTYKASLKRDEFWKR